MIRPITPDDAATVAAIAVDSDRFPADADGFLATMMADYVARNRAAGHLCLIDGTRDTAIGVAYYQPALATDRTWYLTLITVRRAAQGQGRGTALMRAMEQSLRTTDQRLVLVETSGLPTFAQTRAFYARCGYEAEARVRDYYAAGEDMILFRKALGDG